jgi:hypothetical protein
VDAYGTRQLEKYNYVEDQLDYTRDFFYHNLLPDSGESIIEIIGDYLYELQKRWYVYLNIKPRDPAFMCPRNLTNHGYGQRKIILITDEAKITLGPNDVGQFFSCDTLTHIMERITCRVYKKKNGQNQVLLSPRMPEVGGFRRSEVFGRYKAQYAADLNMRMFIKAPDDTPENARSWDLSVFLEELAE